MLHLILDVADVDVTEGRTDQQTHCTADHENADDDDSQEEMGSPCDQDIVLFLYLDVADVDVDVDLLDTALARHVTCMFKILPAFTFGSSDVQHDRWRMFKILPAFTFGSSEVQHDRWRHVVVIVVNAYL
jgi:hypothetical protein